MFLRNLSKSISELCKLSISRGIFRDACKVISLRPICRKGKKTDLSNYRPTSLLSVISKVIERAVHDQTNTFLLENNNLYRFQSGFRLNHSTNLGLSHLTGIKLKDLMKAY